MYVKIGTPRICCDLNEKVWLHRRTVLCSRSHCNYIPGLGRQPQNPFCPQMSPQPLYLTITAPIRLPGLSTLPCLKSAPAFIPFLLSLPSGLSSTTQLYSETSQNGTLLTLSDAFNAVPVQDRLPVDTAHMISLGPPKTSGSHHFLQVTHARTEAQEQLTSGHHWEAGPGFQQGSAWV